MRLLFLLLIAGTLRAQSYYVVSVQDTIYADGRPLHPGDRLTADTPLRFGAATATAYLLSPNEGYFQLTAPAARSKSRRSDAAPNELLVAVRNALVPPTRQYLTATRSERGLRFKDRYDLMGYFDGNVLMVDESRYLLTDLALDDVHYLTVNTAGRPATKLPSVAGGFVLPAAALSAHPTAHELRYVTNGQTTTLGTFVPHVTTRSRLTEELRPFFELQPDLPAPRIYAEQVAPYLRQRYGHFDELQVVETLEEALAVVL